MKTLLCELRRSILLTALFTLVLCGLYPLAVWGGAHLLFAEKAEGSLLTDAQGKIRGSRLLGQAFANPQYFLPRPSAAGTGYDAANSSGTNLGPTSKALLDSIKSATVAYREQNALPENAEVPADAVTSSASGLDPHISIANARIQALRIARLRHLPIERVLALVERFTDQRDLGILGEPGVNVLPLNLALDAL